MPIVDVIILCYASPAQKLFMLKSWSKLNLRFSLIVSRYQVFYEILNCFGIKLYGNSLNYWDTCNVFRLIYFICICVLAYMFIYVTHLSWHLRMPEESIRFLGARLQTAVSCSVGTECMRNKDQVSLFHMEKSTFLLPMSWWCHLFSIEYFWNLCQELGIYSCMYYR